MSEPGCANCPWRAKYDARPKSILGRLWRWHASFCPGWRSYLAHLPQDQKKLMIERYHLPPSKFA